MSLFRSFVVWLGAVAGASGQRQLLVAPLVAPVPPVQLAPVALGVTPPQAVSAQVQSSRVTGKLSLPSLDTGVAPSRGGAEAVDSASVYHDGTLASLSHSGTSGVVSSFSRDSQPLSDVDSRTGLRGSATIGMSPHVQVMSLKTTFSAMALMGLVAALAITWRRRSATRIASPPLGAPTSELLEMTSLAEPKYAAAALAGEKGSFVGSSLAKAPARQGVAANYGWMANIKVPSIDNVFQTFAGSKFGDKKLVVITGTSSGLGLATTKALLRTEKYHVIGACRNLAKMDVVAEENGFNMEHFTPMHLDLASFASVHSFVEELDKIRGDRPIDRLMCNAAVYQPTLNYPKWTEDGHEQQHQINYFSHFLLISKVMPKMQGSDDARICMLGSVTGNDNTVGGGGVYPIADLKNLEGLELGCKKPIAMMDGYNFNGAKAYKDTKLACMMTCNMLHERFHRSTGIAFSSVYPGCIAETPLFREKRAWFRQLFPIFMKYVTGGYVGEQEAGQRLFQVLTDPRCTKSGVYWGWNGGPREGREDALETGGQITGAGGAGGGWNSIFENDQSDKVLNKDLMMKLWNYSNEVTGAEWPEAYQPKSPCPTLKVIEAATSVLGVIEERARMEASRQGEGAAIVSDHDMPKEQRRKCLEEMLLKLDKTPTDPKQLEEDLLLTSGMAPVVERSQEPSEPIKAEVKAEHAVVPVVDDPFLEEKEEEKGPPQMIEGHELLGDTPVVFQPQNVMTMARVGQPLSEVAAQADVFIRYKCRKGECKTCAVNIDGKWVSACQTKIEAQAPGEHFGVRVRPVTDAQKKKEEEKAAFFSPESVKDGFFNNAFGMFGFVKEGLGSNDDFAVRMERERRIEELTAMKAKNAHESLEGVREKSPERVREDSNA